MREPLFACQECGRKFYTVKAAEKASNDGCPGCNGTDIDTYVRRDTSYDNERPSPTFERVIKEGA